MKQIEGSNKSEATSPTVSLESVLIKATIDAFEHRDVVIVDVSGTYLTALADLEDNGFVLNHYDPCVANKVVNSKQLTIMWNVDDLKLSHSDENEVTKAIDWLKSIYGEDMRVSRGNKYDYLGMDLIYD
jgi:hypothetical protein